jgi:hypothetical protein
MQTRIRPPAVPLVTIDPYFSVWSMADRLTDDFTRHWTGKRNAMTGLIRIDGVPWRFIGFVQHNEENYYTEPDVMPLKDFQLSPLSSTYVYEQSGVSLKVQFTSPLLMDDLNLLSRPASYISLSVRSIDGKPHQVQVYFDVTGEWCVDTSDQSVVWQHEAETKLHFLQMGNKDQNILHRSGDDVRIDWGQLYLVTRNSPHIYTCINTAEIRKKFLSNKEFTPTSEMVMPQVVKENMPVMASVFNWESVDAEEQSELIVLAYDDIYAITYFGDHLQAYWRRNGLSTKQMLQDAYNEYPDIMKRCSEFDQHLIEEGQRAGGDKYTELLILSYRQAIAAHKLVEDRDGQLLFMSKECYSNGCIATVDVSYPSIPLFLLYRPELIKAMMRPIFHYAASEAWPFEFAPHDVGQYPIANGQVYADNELSGQMPIEECGNMLIMAAAVSLADKQASFAAKHWDLLTAWANYLLAHGLDPANQLCTDDFAGHLERNANLSIKAIMGIASYSLLLDMQGHTVDAQRWKLAAQSMAEQWEQLAHETDHYQLAFGAADTWSLKYNLIWDIIFGTDIFAKKIYEQEVQWYLDRAQKYGTPLDNRANYTKSDWLVWVASLASSQEEFVRLIEPLWLFANETPDRVPFSDWYDTTNARQMNFQHRSVVGGLFMKLLKDRGLTEQSGFQYDSPI